MPPWPNKKRKMKSHEIIQTHHIVYPREGKPQDEVTTRVTKSEHYVLTVIQRLKRPLSSGFLKSLRCLEALHSPGEDK